MGITPDEKEYEKALVDVEDYHSSLSKKLASKDKEALTYKWQMDLPFTSYSGVYHSDVLGDITVTTLKGTHQIKFGELKGLATPSSEKNTMKIELIPGRAMNLTFIIDENKNVKEISSGGLIFKKR